MRSVIMYKFSAQSKTKLDTCHPDIQKVLNLAIKFVDITIIEGIRTIETQQEYVRTGKSKTLDSKHLKQDDGYSHAVDCALYPVDWSDKARFIWLGGYLQGIADTLYQSGEIKNRLTWGGDWDNDQNIKEHSFFDGPHFQLRIID